MSRIVVITISITHVQVCFIFSVVRWAYVCMFWLLSINVDISSLFRQLYSKKHGFIQAYNFGKRCDDCRKPVKPVLWSTQIPWDICSHFGRYLHSTEWSWIIMRSKHMANMVNATFGLQMWHLQPLAYIHSSLFLFLRHICKEQKAPWLNPFFGPVFDTFSTF